MAGGRLIAAVLFSLGCPSALNEVESVDWAPTVKLGHQKRKPKSKALRKRTERIKVKEEAAEVLLDLHESPENPEQKIKLEMLHYQQGKVIVLGVACICIRRTGFLQQIIHVNFELGLHNRSYNSL